MLFRPNEEITVDQIIERIPKSARHRDLERQVQALRSEWGRLHDAHRATIAQHLGELNRTGHQGAAAAREINAIAARLKATQDEQREVAQKLAPLKQEYGARLGAALRPKQKELAGQALEALNDLAAIWEELGALTQLVESSGGSLGRVPPLALFLIERELERLAGK